MVVLMWTNGNLSVSFSDVCMRLPITLMKYKWKSPTRLGQSSSARISIADHRSDQMTSGYSRAISAHEYASTPPRKPKKVKRSMMDQFNTHYGCSEPKAYVVQTDRLESGHSTTKAREKRVPVFVRKEQPRNGKFCDLGQYAGNPNKLTESRACEALARLEEQKRAREERERAYALQMERQRINEERQRAKALERNSLENAFRR